MSRDKLLSPCGWSWIVNPGVSSVAYATPAVNGSDSCLRQTRDNKLGCPERSARGAGLWTAALAG